MVVIAVVNGQLTQAFARKLTGATAAHVGVHFQGFVAIAHLAVTLGIRQDAIQFGGMGRWVSRTHGFTFKTNDGQVVKFSC